jgi:hypothetical protein
VIENDADVQTALATLDRLALRDLTNRVVVDDLAALGVRRPDLTWARAREYLAGLRRAAKLELRRSLREFIIYAGIKKRWQASGSPPWGPSRDDIDDAVLAYERLFSEKAPILSDRSGR